MHYPGRYIPRPGEEYYDEPRSIVRYCSDGANTAVFIPDGKTVASITPESVCSVLDREDGARYVIFADAFRVGVMVEIVLKNEE